MSDYQVIIIGGRPAGASLAIRLGRQNIKTLLVDRMTFPSLPSVPSSPILYSQHLDMLQELGIPESEAFHPSGRMDTLAATFVNYFSVSIPLSMAEVSHSYAYGADRNKFDATLWEHASNYPSVTALSGFAVTDILKANGKVIGIKAQTEQNKEESFTADLVVGADGRFSFTAQQVEAAVIEEHNDFITTSYQAEWENVADDAIPYALSTYNTGKGFMILMIPIDTRKYIVATYMRPEHHKQDKKAEESYLEDLQRITPVWERLAEAKQVTPVVGIKGIRNGMRQSSGDGWALVGDAFHYKDPSDGQGIYDALIQTKFLGEAIHEWLNGGKSWEQVRQQYDHQAITSARPMMLRTVRNVKGMMFADPPPFIIKTVVRWMMNNPSFQRDLLRGFTRASDPSKGPNAGIIARAVLQGMLTDLFRRKRAAPVVAAP